MPGSHVLPHGLCCLDRGPRRGHQLALGRRVHLDGPVVDRPRPAERVIAHRLFVRPAHGPQVLPSGLSRLTDMIVRAVVGRREVLLAPVRGLLQLHRRHRELAVRFLGGCLLFKRLCVLQQACARRGPQQAGAASASGRNNPPTCIRTLPAPRCKLTPSASRPHQSRASRAPVRARHVAFPPSSRDCAPVGGASHCESQTPSSSLASGAFRPHNSRAALMRRTLAGVRPDKTISLLVTLSRPLTALTPMLCAHKSTGPTGRGRQQRSVAMWQHGQLPSAPSARAKSNAGRAPCGRVSQRTAPKANTRRAKTRAARTQRAVPGCAPRPPARRSRAGPSGCQSCAGRPRGRFERALPRSGAR